jgi:hypothetical protein
VFEIANPLRGGLTLLTLLAAAAFFLRNRDEAFWGDSETVQCPHCLSEVPAAARVCSYCTRDIS